MALVQFSLHDYFLRLQKRPVDLGEFDSLSALDRLGYRRLSGIQTA